VISKLAALVLVALPFACSGGTPAPIAPAPPPIAEMPTAMPSPVATSTPSAPSTPTPATPADRACGGAKLRVHFYNVAQALAALVDLPDGRSILVDTGDLPKRSGCGEVCTDAHASLMTKLAADLHGRPIDLLWITHPHSDHIGGALDILGRFPVKSYVDNGRDLAEAEIRKVHTAASAKGVTIAVVEPGHEQLPMPAGGDVKLTGIAPSSWLPGCNANRNDCSILLRIDYCASSILFTGDAEVAEEALIDPRGKATLLQVGHHGSDTSSGAAFLAKVQPKYAVISAGKEGEGMNEAYCHPRASTVTALTQLLGGPGTKPVHAFRGGVKCKKSTGADWSDVAASDHLWATMRDGDVVLGTAGDGVFVRD
jgi:competence protein ComEC